MVFLPNQIIFFLLTRKLFYLPDQKQTIFFLSCHRQTFFQTTVKRACRHAWTVTCRPTVAYIEYRLTA